MIVRLCIKDPFSLLPIFKTMVLGGTQMHNNCAIVASKSEAKSCLEICVEEILGRTMA